MLFEHFKKCNDPVPEVYVPRIQHDRAQLQHRIASIQNEIDAMNAKKSHLLEQKHVLDCLLSPIRRVPNEIISQVMEATLIQLFNMGWEDRLRLTNLRCVCKLWNSIALSNPILWRSWDERSNAMAIAPKSFVSKATSWFLRGGAGAPLRLNLWRRIGDDPEDIFLSFITSPWNWIELTLFVSPKYMAKIMSKIQKKSDGPWSNLERLSIYVEDVQEEIFVVDFGKFLPSLQYFLIAFPNIMEGSTPEDLPVATVHHPTVTSFCYAETLADNVFLYKVITPSNLPGLRNLVLEHVMYDGFIDYTPAIFPPIVLPVEQLIVKGSHSLLSFDNFTCPHLRTFQAVEAREDQEDPLGNAAWDAALSFVRRSTRSLETLCLRQSRLPAEKCAMLINSLDTCQTLQVPNGQFVFDVGHMHEHYTGFWSSLSTIVSGEPFFHENDSGAFDHRLAVRVASHLRLRRQIQRQVRRLTIINPGRIPPSSGGHNGVVYLTALCEEGLLHLPDGVRDLGCRILPTYRSFSDCLF
ncbi:hypothetical protein BKA70DRAFT_1401271 [Coprinopsis sp. MPI-PUGE-AT-0042]|nr:hypothetical protein BKA70DRAFT_1401271 [Coprinopsis sp. MPI-PUGE-AT-0042]